MNKFFMSEEDSDFMPIIPINESDADQEKLEIAGAIPILPLKKYRFIPRCGAAHHCWKG